MVAPLLAPLARAAAPLAQNVAFGAGQKLAEKGLDALKQLASGDEGRTNRAISYAKDYAKEKSDQQPAVY